jgi:hypothetical protein
MSKIRSAVERSSLGAAKAAAARRTVPASTAAKIVRSASTRQEVWGVTSKDGHTSGT